MAEQSTSRANEHRSRPCKRDLTHPAQAWGSQRERQAAPESWGRGGSSSWASSGKQPLLAAQAVRGLNRPRSVPRTAWGWAQGSSSGEVMVSLHMMLLLEAEVFLFLCPEQLNASSLSRRGGCMSPTPETILLLCDIWMRRASSCIISICRGGCCHLPALLGTVGDAQGSSTRGIHPA